MSLYSKKEIIVFGVVFMFFLLAVFGWRTYRLYQPDAVASQEEAALLLYERITIEPLIAHLDSIGVRFNEDELAWASRVLGWRQFMPGRYVIDGSTSYSQLLSKLARGVQDPVLVTVLPGTDTARFSLSLARQLRADSSAFRSFFTDSSSLALELGVTGEELFSRMLPNTYQMYWTSAPESVIRRIYNEFEKTIAERYRTEIENHSFSLDQIVTLASIVEWEARVREEKPRISGLYLNRLNRNMMLQADPTVIYALGERRRLLFEDYQYDHPYNTYLIRGLPPGPITNPDESSILAILRPEQHDYLYMVATPDGTHRFSRTFEEHRAASEEWRQWIREQYRIRQLREREEDESP